MRHLLLWTFAVICLAALIWPGYAVFGNRIEPLVFGLPFSMAWVLAWLLLAAVALLVFHLSAPAPDDGDGAGK